MENKDGLGPAMDDFLDAPEFQARFYPRPSGWPFPSVDPAAAEEARADFERREMEEKLNAAHMISKRMIDFMRTRNLAHWDAAMMWLPKEKK